MLNSQHILSNKRKHPVIGLLLLVIGLVCVAFSITGNDDFTLARREIVLRRIGHELLLQSGDSLSRVLPVKQIADHVYQISFEQSFSFQPEQLVHTTQRLLAKEPETQDYVVHVLRCDQAGVVYGFAVSGNKQNDLISCLGRKQPKACYIIQIKFPAAGPISTKNGLLLGSLAFLAVVGYVFWKPGKPRTGLAEQASPNAAHASVVLQPAVEAQFSLGSIVFDVEARILMHQDQTIELTKTETRVLHIFAQAPNEVIERSRLQKEIWEDEGVIVGRSLDVFISKLRKKLELDTRIRISVIRGKGYKLEIDG